MAKILDGNKVKESILSELKEEIRRYAEVVGRVPGLAVILVGDNAASKTYVAMKKKACEQIGIKSVEYRLPADEGEENLIRLIQSLNANPEINGILLQLPLPKGYDEEKLLDLISPAKDIDGFHPFNVGRLVLELPGFKPCTPYGVCELLKFYDIDTNGKHAVILGRSHIVGKPMAALLVQKGDFGNATVTICHSHTNHLSTITQTADILIAAMGKPEFVTGDMIKQGAVVIDVGINRVSDPESEKGYRITGDVNFASVSPKASAITPVPGGVGAMTIAMLMKNTVQAFVMSLTEEEKYNLSREKNVTGSRREGAG